MFYEDKSLFLIFLSLHIKLSYPLIFIHVLCICLQINSRLYIAALFFHMGMFIGFLVGTLTDWRTTAAICSSVPVITFLINLLLPETPPYLVSKGKIKEAEKSLCWLRGWVKPRYVQQELKELIKIHEENNVNNRFPRPK